MQAFYGHTTPKGARPRVWPFFLALASIALFLSPIALLTLTGSLSDDDLSGAKSAEQSVAATTSPAAVAAPPAGTRRITSETKVVGFTPICTNARALETITALAAAREYDAAGRVEGCWGLDDGTKVIVVRTVGEFSLIAASEKVISRWPGTASVMPDRLRTVRVQSYEPLETPAFTTPANGAEVTTVKRLFTAVCKSEATLTLLYRQYAAGKFMEEHPETARDCWLVDQGQKVSVLRASADHSLIEILDGPRKGRAWIASDDLKP